MMSSRTPNTNAPVWPAAYAPEPCGPPRMNEVTRIRPPHTTPIPPKIRLRMRSTPRRSIQLMRQQPTISLIIAAVRSFPYQLSCFRSIVRNAVPENIQIAKMKLRRSVAVRRRLLIPRGGLAVILKDTEPVLVQIGNVIFRVLIVLVRGFSIPFHRELIVDRFNVGIHPTQLRFPSRIAELGAPLIIASSLSRVDRHSHAHPGFPSQLIESHGHVTFRSFQSPPQRFRQIAVGANAEK